MVILVISLKGLLILIFLLPQEENGFRQKLLVRGLQILAITWLGLSRGALLLSCGRWVPVFG
jgi:hypothetical protein